MTRKGDTTRCYACDADATATADFRLEGGELEPACERHARVKEMFAKTRMGSIHVGNEDTFAKLKEIAKQAIAIDRTRGWEMRALIVIATEIAAVAAGEPALDATADALLDAGALCGFHAGLGTADVTTHVSEAWDMAADHIAVGNAAGGVH